jgi:hypothetical protein
MLRTLALIGAHETGFCRRLAATAAARGTSCFELSLDAPLRNEPVSIGPGAVLWQGTDLLSVGAVFVEAPLFPWPQPQMLLEIGFEHPAPGARTSPEREARSLALSALKLASMRRPVWNMPEAAHLAACPAVALDRLALAGLAVHPWSLEPAPEEPRGGRLVVDAAGRDRWHRPGTPPPGEPSIVLDPVRGAQIDLLLVGGALAGARGTCAGDLPAQAAELAAAAARSLALAIAAVSIDWVPGSPDILSVEAGPDLADWDTRLDGRLALLLIEKLEGAADGANS